MRTSKTSRRRGFTLVEVVICLIIVMMAGFATVGAITYTRLNMELEKQRLAALNYCRQSMEAIQSLRTMHSGKVSLVPFNQPGITDLDADLTISYYRLNENGSVNRTAAGKVFTPSNEEPIYAEVKVSWVPHGSMARPQEVSMATILTMGIN